MTETIATAQWRALDRDGTDKCRLVRHADGWMLLGHARFRDGSGWAALDYVLRCDADWFPTSCDVTGSHAGSEIALRLQRENGGWTLNDIPRPALEACRDIDLGFTPASNLIPLRRLPEVGKLDVCAAWLRLPGPGLDPADQTYTRERGGYVEYASETTGFSTHLQVDLHGFVSHYPGLWERVHDG